MPESLANSLPIFRRIHRSLRTRPSSISKSLITTITLIVVLTVLLGALPTAAAILLQLQRQVELRVQSAQLVTYALYDAERERLSTFVSTFTERPTLCKLLQEGSTEELTSYLDTLQEGTPIDTLMLVDNDQTISISGLADLPQPMALRGLRSLPFTDYVALDNPARLLIISAGQIQSKENCILNSTAWLMAVQVFDNQEMRTLAEQTGLEQSLIVAGYRAATSLKTGPDWSLNPEAAEAVGQTLTSCCISGASEGEDFYLGLAPLVDNQGTLVAISEAALPGNAIIRTGWNAIALLFGSSLVIALVSAYLGISLTRRITRPISELAAVAERISKGDLEQPIPTESGWIEINPLAEQLEVSRRHLRKMLQVNRSEITHFTNMLSAIREGVVVLDQEGLLIWLNPIAEQVLGRRSADVVGFHYSQVFRPAPGETATLRQVLEQRPEQPQISRFSIIDAENHTHLLAVSISRIDASEEPGSRQERVLVFHDLSEEVAFNRLRSEFLVNMAHEFRTPLSSIAASIEMLSDEGDSMSADELTELANTTRLSTQHLQTLVDNLLERFTIESGCFRLRRHPILAQEVIDKTADIMSPLLKRRQQHLTLDIQQNLPTIWADPDRLSQVLVNLIENASKYSPFGTEIIIAAKCQESVLLIEVLDQGPGVPPNRLGDLFKPYFTLSDLRGAQTGIGLGLPVVKAIVEAHDGVAGADNLPQGGFRFWFTLPLDPQTDNI